MSSSDLMNNENTQSEEFSFKPITAGLGFHHEKATFPKTKINLNNTGNSKAPSATVKPKANAASNMQIEVNADLKQNPLLQKIYGANTTANRAQKNLKVAGPESATVKPNLVDIPVMPQLLAWLIDMAIITLGTVLIILCASFITFGDFIAPFYSSFSGDFYLLFATLFCLFYLFYFTLMDLNSSIGKSIFSIKIISLEKEKIEMRDTFIRAFVTLISFLGLGIPTLLDFQGKLSKTALKK